MLGKIREGLGKDYSVESFGNEIYAKKNGVKFASVVVGNPLRISERIEQVYPITLQVEVRMYGLILRKNSPTIFCSETEHIILSIKKMLNTPESISEVGRYER